ncbi:MAG: hypothetical protein JWR80_4812 [Bradyrhizobium sp.]|nr:hypothetical protein [Bradyrhizobium sp.]
MNGTRPRHIVALFCSDLLALALGAKPANQPAHHCRLMKRHMPGLKAGAVIAMMARSGEKYLWPCQGAA